MSDVKRYSDLDVWRALHLEGSTNGWVRWEEYERLRASSFVTAVPVEQYERVVKAGDEVLREWSMGDEKGAKNYLKALVIWNAAKEGKPSV
jgi:hypothetical protein